MRNTNNSNFLKVGNYLSNNFVLLNDKGCRTQKQYEAALSIIQTPEFLFACGNPFSISEEGEEYSLTFAFRYFTTDGYFHSVRITPSGRIKEHYCSDKPSFLKEVTLTQEKISQLKKLN